MNGFCRGKKTEIGLSSRWKNEWVLQREKDRNWVEQRKNALDLQRKDVEFFGHKKNEWFS